MAFKKKIGKILKNILSERMYRLIANGVLCVPAYYKTIIEDAEKNMTYSLEENADKDLLLMRKYGHILDKGLHRRDATAGHSKNYYALLKDMVEKLSKTEYAADPTLLWAKEKLALYESLQREPDKFVPLSSERKEAPIDYDTFLELVKGRRSNRFFEEKTISEETAKKLEVVSNWSASSCNKQPIKLFYTLDPKLATECLKCCKGGTGFSEYIPSFWAFAADSRGYVWPSEISLPYIDTSLGAQNVYLAAHTLGISGTVLSWAQKSEEEERRLRELLNIPKEYVIVFCSVMGYASYNYLPPRRKM